MKYIKLFLLLLLSISLVGCKPDPKIEELSIPTNVRFEDILRWDTVENATEYHILIGDESFITNNNYFVFSEQGEYSVRVKAVASGYIDSEPSEAIELSLIYEYIIEPNIRVEDDQILWDQIEDAVSYNLFINGDKSNTTNNYSDILGNGAFEISIQAVYPVGVSNVSEITTVEYNLEEVALRQYQYSKFSEVDILLFTTTPASNLYAQDETGAFINAAELFTEVDGKAAIKSEFITNNPIGVVSFYVIDLDKKIPVEISLSDKTTPYIISSTLINTSGNEDVLLQFELFQGEIYSINGTAQDTVPWSVENGVLTIEKEFITMKFGLSSQFPAEFTLTYVINVGEDSVIGYLYFTGIEE